MTKLTFVFFLAILYSFKILAQTQDLEFWPSAQLNYNLSKEFRISGEQQLRLDQLNQNNLRFKTTFTNLALRYRISKYIRIRANYRFIIRQTNAGNIRIRQRIAGDLLARYRKKKFPVRLNYRLRYQVLYPGQGRNPRKFLRNKLAVSYNASRLVDPFVAGELYYRIRNKPNEFQKYRLFLGLDFRLNKKSDLTLFYLYQREINVNNPALDHVIGMGYSFTLL
ncbi:MAG: DUF2490 domain-containing protein [Cytophagales bacterium]|nr:DUF2490 domain-containing protein [Cytophagales bacterium]